MKDLQLFVDKHLSLSATQKMRRQNAAAVLIERTVHISAVVKLGIYQNRGWLQNS